MTDISTKLEQATAGSREADAEIAVAVGWRLEKFNCQNINGATEIGELWFSPHDCDEAINESKQEYRDLVRVNHWPTENGLPDFSTSLDAAMTLVPEGWCFQIDESGWALVERKGAADACWHNARAATPALALCAASIRAQEG